MPENPNFAALNTALGVPCCLTRFEANGNMETVVSVSVPRGRTLNGWRLPRKYAPKWRNWQTRYIQDVVPVRAWRFESSLRHQVLALQIVVAIQVDRN